MTPQGGEQVEIKVEDVTDPSHSIGPLQNQLERSCLGRADDKATEFRELYHEVLRVRELALYVVGGKGREQAQRLAAVLLGSDYPHARAGNAESASGVPGEREWPDKAPKNPASLEEELRRLRDRCRETVIMQHNSCGLLGRQSFKGDAHHGEEAAAAPPYVLPPRDLDALCGRHRGLAAILPLRNSSPPFQAKREFLEEEAKWLANASSVARLCRMGTVILDSVTYGIGPRLTELRAIKAGKMLDKCSCADAPSPSPGHLAARGGDEGCLAAVDMSSDKDGGRGKGKMSTTSTTGELVQAFIKQEDRDIPDEHHGIQLPAAAEDVGNGGSGSNGGPGANNGAGAVSGSQTAGRRRRSGASRQVHVAASSEQDAATSHKTDPEVVCLFREVLDTFVDGGPLGDMMPPWVLQRQATVETLDRKVDSKLWPWGSFWLKCGGIFVNEEDLSCKGRR
ncbi:hypothetical protein JDV02_003572 [Purpureocillium takamizusanense]|uniref:Uncharacterized protein n=1 Tax=Purpureocillium takamizusanense TaxID=2060973 RepID=A0A9Q8QDD4_9HYPO|nr:uncharacterized protein JDV02_003572 [Purpureocillium takamizusanense]UNI17202.1 hypothetical protein JDV02_003572 [Purpureocillium takamizusanense]